MKRQWTLLVLIAILIPHLYCEVRLLFCMWHWKANRQAMIRNWYNQIPYPALKTEREITKYIKWQQFTKGTRGKPNEQLFLSFPNQVRCNPTTQHLYANQIKGLLLRRKKGISLDWVWRRCSYLIIVFCLKRFLADPDISDESWLCSR